MRTKCARLYAVLTAIIVGFCCVSASALPIDSLGQLKRKAEQSHVVTLFDGVHLTIQNVDLSSFPEIGLVVECEGRCAMLDTINPRTLNVIENGVKRPVTRITKVDLSRRVAIDFMFVVDVTGTMQPYINGIRRNIGHFVSNLQKRGIDYRIGLILFTDDVEAVYSPTDSVQKFMNWISSVYATGGGDEKENALQALHDASKVKWRPAANRVVVIVSDAEYHQETDVGPIKSRFTTSSISKLLDDASIRAFCIVPPYLSEYKRLAENTRGAIFDIKHPFAEILEEYSQRLTNLYMIYYRSDSQVRSDSINVAVVDESKRVIVRQIIPIIELGRKIIIENLLFPVGSFVLPDTVEELEVLYEFMTSRPTVRVRIEGHTDNTGSPKSNQSLSLRRAEAVRVYMIKRGIEALRLIAVGIGSAKPIGDNLTEEGRRLNRRTEIVIVGK